MTPFELGFRCKCAQISGSRHRLLKTAAGAVPATTVRPSIIPKGYFDAITQQAAQSAGRAAGNAAVPAVGAAAQAPAAAAAASAAGAQAGAPAGPAAAQQAAGSAATPAVTQQATAQAPVTSSVNAVDAAARVLGITDTTGITEEDAKEFLRRRAASLAGGTGGVESLSPESLDQIRGKDPGSLLSFADWLKASPYASEIDPAARETLDSTFLSARTPPRYTEEFLDYLRDADNRGWLGDEFYPEFDGEALTPTEVPQYGPVTKSRAWSVLRDKNPLHVQKITDAYDKYVAEQTAAIDAYQKWLDSTGVVRSLASQPDADNRIGDLRTALARATEAFLARDPEPTIPPPPKRTGLFSFVPQWQQKAEDDARFAEHNEWLKRRAAATATQRRALEHAIKVRDALRDRISKLFIQ